jgi:excisionase family DNA binding protein
VGLLALSAIRAMRNRTLAFEATYPMSPAYVGEITWGFDQFPVRQVNTRLLYLSNSGRPPAEPEGSHPLNTCQVARLLGVSVSLLAKAVWCGRVDPPQKSPSGNFLWTEPDIDRASWVLHRRSFDRRQAAADGSGGRLVCILPDKDKVGWRYAKAIVESLQAVAAEVILAEVPGSHKDISEYIEERDAADEQTLRAEVTRVIDTAKPAKPTPAGKNDPPGGVVPRPAVTPLLVAPREAAKMLAICERTLFALTKSGQIPALRIGRAVRYSVDDLKAWIKKKCESG